MPQTKHTHTLTLTHTQPLIKSDSHDGWGQIESPVVSLVLSHKQPLFYGSYILSACLRQFCSQYCINLKLSRFPVAVCRERERASEGKGKSE